VRNVLRGKQKEGLENMNRLVHTMKMVCRKWLHLERKPSVTNVLFTVRVFFFFFCHSPFESSGVAATPQKVF
jgi:hypothetical protein